MLEIFVYKMKVVLQRRTTREREWPKSNQPKQKVLIYLQQNHGIVIRIHTPSIPTQISLEECIINPV